MVDTTPAPTVSWHNRTAGGATDRTGGSVRAMAARRSEEPAVPLVARRRETGLDCPECGSPRVARMLGANGGMPHVCTSRRHSWS